MIPGQSSSRGTVKENVSSILVHLETTAYGNLESQATSIPIFEEAWNRNPFLADFGTPWDVELSFDAKLTTQDDGVVDDYYFGVDETPDEERGFYINFCFNQINLLHVCGTEFEDTPVSQRAADLAKRLFASILLSTHAASDFINIPALLSSLNEQYEEWEARLANDDTLLANKFLWSAIRNSSTKLTNSPGTLAATENMRKPRRSELHARTPGKTSQHPNKSPRAPITGKVEATVKKSSVVMKYSVINPATQFEKLLDTSRTTKSGKQAGNQRHEEILGKRNTDQI